MTMYDTVKYIDTANVQRDKDQERGTILDHEWHGTIKKWIRPISVIPQLTGCPTT
jgi:hypothetical protein